jgi:hypothetical protein
MSNRGDRLVFSNGIVLLSLVAGVLIVGFNANVTRLIQLYILGVFLSFTLSQASMVIHWQQGIRAVSQERGALRGKQAINGLGAIVTGVVFLIVLVTKFAAGAWMVVVATPFIFLVMKRVARHYKKFESALKPGVIGAVLPAKVHAVVLVSNLLAPTLRALAYAQATDPATLRAVKISDEDVEDELPGEWATRGVPVPLVVVESPFRETVRPTIEYLRQLRRENPGDVVSVIIPEYVVNHWWQNLLHNQNALRIKTRLRFEPSLTVTSVPWHIDLAHREPSSPSDTLSTDPQEVEVIT